jgi:glucose/arabinose dehydrogenase
VGIGGSIRRTRRALLAGGSGLLLAAAIAAGATGGSVPNARAAGTLHAVKLGTFQSPLYVAQAPGEPKLVFVVEQSGRVMLIDNGTPLARPFLGIRDRVLSPADPDGGGEQGLLSIAFPPDYQTSGRFYVYFTNNDGNVEIDEFMRSATDPTVANPATRRQVIVIPHPTYGNHNGGTMQFGPAGYLYFATGDGGGVTQLQGKNAPDLNSLLGKVIRINPLPRGNQPYGIPRTNPFVGAPGRDEIFAYGLRNPFRFSFDGDARIAIGDVGQHQWEEIDLLRVRDARGANFGWPYYEGDHVYGGVMGPGPPTFPILEIPHNPACAVIGGYVVHDPKLPSLDGRYLYGDHCATDLRSFIPNLNGQQAMDDSPTGVTANRLAGFGQGLNGQIYFAAGSGVYRLAETP